MPLFEQPLPDEGAPLEVAPEDRQIAVARAIADGRGLRGDVVRGCVSAHRLVAEGDRQQEVTMLGALAGLRVDQRLPARQPRAAAPGLAEGHRAKPEPERRARGLARRARVEPRLVHALERLLEVVVSSRALRGLGQQIEILGAERCARVARREGLVGLGPDATPVGVPPAVEVGRWRLA